MTVLYADVYERPHGTKKTIEVKRVDAQDAEWFNQHNVRISMEEISTGQIVIYGDYGRKLVDGTPIEELVMGHPNRVTCEQLLHRLREQIEESLAAE